MANRSELDPNARYLDLDLTKLGDALVRFALTARQLGHGRVARTVEDYSHPHPSGDSLELEFVRDVFLTSPEDIATRWFGGSDNAVRLTSAVITAGHRDLPL